MCENEITAEEELIAVSTLMQSGVHREGVCTSIRGTAEYMQSVETERAEAVLRYLADDDESPVYFMTRERTEVTIQYREITEISVFLSRRADGGNRALF